MPQGRQVYTNDGGGYSSGSSASNPTSAAGVTYGATSASQNYSYGGSASWQDQLRAISDYNNAFNLQQVREVNSFNAEQAAADRAWQKMMSDTAHQREVKDLIAAGLNPILSAGGQGASTPVGAQATGQKAVADSIYGNGMISLMSAALSASSALQVAKVYAAAQMYSADKSYDRQGTYNEMWKITNALTNATSSANNERSNSTDIGAALIRMIGSGMFYGAYRKTRGY